MLSLLVQSSRKMDLPLFLDSCDIKIIQLILSYVTDGSTLLGFTRKVCKRINAFFPREHVVHKPFVAIFLSLFMGNESWYFYINLNDFYELLHHKSFLEMTGFDLAYFYNFADPLVNAFFNCEYRFDHSTGKTSSAIQSKPGKRIPKPYCHMKLSLNGEEASKKLGSSNSGQLLFL